MRPPGNPKRLSRGRQEAPMRPLRGPKRPPKTSTRAPDRRYSHMRQRRLPQGTPRPILHRFPSKTLVREVVILCFLWPRVLPPSPGTVAGLAGGSWIVMLACSRAALLTWLLACWYICMLANVPELLSVCFIVCTSAICRLMSVASPLCCLLLLAAASSPALLLPPAVDLLQFGDRALRCLVLVAACLLLLAVCCYLVLVM